MRTKGTNRSLFKRQTEDTGIELDRNMSILIVDDFQSMRGLIKSILRKLSFTKLLEAEDGEKAWELLEGQKVDLVISDWNMPNMPGITLLKKVREDERFAKLPFLMVTTEGHKEFVIEAMQAGVSGYILKPFSPYDMEMKIKKIFAKAGG